MTRRRDDAARSAQRAADAERILELLAQRGPLRYTQIVADAGISVDRVSRALGDLWLVDQTVEPDPAVPDGAEAVYRLTRDDDADSAAADAIARIAREMIGRDLIERGSDRADFVEVGVTHLAAMLRAAYDAGRASRR